MIILKILKLIDMSGVYIIYGLMILFGIVGLISKLYEIYNDGKKDVLEEMFKNDDISASVYKKYKK